MKNKNVKTVEGTVEDGLLKIADLKVKFKQNTYDAVLYYDVPKATRNGYTNPTYLLVIDHSNYQNCNTQYFSYELKDLFTKLQYKYEIIEQNFTYKRTLPEEWEKEAVKCSH